MCLSLFLDLLTQSICDNFGINKTTNIVYKVISSTFSLYHQNKYPNSESTIKFCRSNFHSLTVVLTITVSLNQKNLFKLKKIKF